MVSISVLEQDETGADKPRPYSRLERARTTPHARELTVSWVGAWLVYARSGGVGVSLGGPVSMERVGPAVRPYFRTTGSTICDGRCSSW